MNSTVIAPTPAPSAGRIRCLLVEDHRLFADLLAMTLVAAPDLQLAVVDVAPSVAAGIAACDRHRPDVVLLDLGLPDGRGLDVAEHVARTLPKTCVIVLSARARDFICPPGLKGCIRGAVDKADSVHALFVTLARLLRPQVVRGDKPGRMPGQQRLSGLLSRREREVLALVGEQLSSRAISQRLGLSIHTVNAHRKNIAQKLGLRGSNLALVAFEYREQLAPGR